MVWNWINETVEFFEMSEKDIIAFLFFGMLFLVLLGIWAIETMIRFYIKNEEKIIIDSKYTVKVMLIPFISLALLLGGKKKERRNKIIARFLYA